MLSETSPPARRIARVSSMLAHFALFLSVLLVAAYAWVWIDVSAFDEVVRRDILPTGVPYTITPAVRILGFGLGLLPLLLSLYCLWTARRLFLGYRNGEIFSEAAGRRLKRIGAALALIPLAQVLVTSLGSLLLTMNNPVGQRHLAISLEDTHLMVGFAGGLLIVIGWVMGEAARIAAENREFV